MEIIKSTNSKHSRKEVDLHAPGTTFLIENTRLNSCVRVNYMLWIVGKLVHSKRNNLPS